MNLNLFSKNETSRLRNEWFTVPRLRLRVRRRRPARGARGCASFGRQAALQALLEHLRYQRDRRDELCG